MAQGLFDFLIDLQTAPDGTIYYGKPLTYEWMRQRIPNPPAKRTLERWLAILRKAGYVSVNLARCGRSVIGIVLRILKPKKWATQQEIFPQRRNDLLAEVAAAGQVLHPTPEAAVTPRHMWRGNSLKTLKEQGGEKSAAQKPAPPHRNPALDPEETKRQIELRGHALRGRRANARASARERRVELRGRRFEEAFESAVRNIRASDERRWDRGVPAGAFGFDDSRDNTGLRRGHQALQVFSKPCGDPRGDVCGARTHAAPETGAGELPGLRRDGMEDRREERPEVGGELPVPEKSRLLIPAKLLRKLAAQKAM